MTSFAGLAFLVQADDHSRSATLLQKQAGSLASQPAAAAPKRAPTVQDGVAILKLFQKTEEEGDDDANQTIHLLDRTRSLLSSSQVYTWYIENFFLNHLSGNVLHTVPVPLHDRRLFLYSVRHARLCCCALQRFYAMSPELYTSGIGSYGAVILLTSKVMWSMDGYMCASRGTQQRIFMKDCIEQLQPYTVESVLHALDIVTKQLMDGPWNPWRVMQLDHLDAPFLPEATTTLYHVTKVMEGAINVIWETALPWILERNPDKSEMTTIHAGNPPRHILWIGERDAAMRHWPNWPCYPSSETPLPPPPQVPPPPPPPPPPKESTGFGSVYRSNGQLLAREAAPALIRTSGAGNVDGGGHDTGVSATWASVTGAQSRGGGMHSRGGGGGGGRGHQGSGRGNGHGTGSAAAPPMGATAGRGGEGGGRGGRGGGRGGRGTGSGTGMGSAAPPLGAGMDGRGGGGGGWGGDGGGRGGRGSGRGSGAARW